MVADVIVVLNLHLLLHPQNYSIQMSLFAAARLKRIERLLTFGPGSLFLRNNRIESMKDHQYVTFLRSFHFFN